MSVNIKKIEQQLKNLKEQLKRGHILDSLEFIGNISSREELDLIREQKLLLKVYEPEKQYQLVKAYQSAAKKILVDGKLLRQTEMYAEFTSIATKRFRKLSNIVNRYRNTIQSVSQLALIELTEEVLADEIGKCAQYHQSVFEKKLHVSNQIATSEASDLTEYLLRQASSSAVDLIYDAARLLNTLIIYANSKNKKTKTKKIFAIKSKLRELIYVSHEWNLLDFFIDKITYGEWFIQELNKENSVNVVFEIADKDLHRAKIIGFRRYRLKSFKRIFSISSSEESDLLKKWFKRQVISLFNAGINFYIQNFTSSSGLPDQLADEYETSKEQLLFLLDTLGPNDELLLAASAQSEKYKSFILGQYLSSIALRCMLLAANFVQKNYQKQIDLTYLEIPIGLIKTLVGEAIKSNELAEKAINAQLSLCQPYLFEISPINHLSKFLIITLLDWKLSVYLIGLPLYIQQLYREER